MMKRVSPRQHFRIDERIRAADAEAGNVNVMIDELCGVDVGEGDLNEIGGSDAEPGTQLFRLFRERATDGMDQTHLIYSNRSSCRALSLSDRVDPGRSRIHQREQRSTSFQTSRLPPPLKTFRLSRDAVD